VRKGQGAQIAAPIDLLDPRDRALSEEVKGALGGISIRRFE
jgi:hypothetical protein